MILPYKNKNSFPFQSKAIVYPLILFFFSQTKGEQRTAAVFITDIRSSELCGKLRGSVCVYFRVIQLLDVKILSQKKKKKNFRSHRLMGSSRLMVVNQLRTF